ncbi:MAG: hypothetical protein WAS05_08455 [Candidatus Nanopelagicales bacterium]
MITDHHHSTITKIGASDRDGGPTSVVTAIRTDALTGAAWAAVAWKPTITPAMRASELTTVTN